MKNLHKPISVTELNNILHDVMDAAFDYPVSVIGEINDVSISANGHEFFELKDESSSIKCIRYASLVGEKNIKEYENKEVIITGNINYYVPKYGKPSFGQIIVSKIVEHGEGRLKEIVEAIRKKLENEGLFEKEEKLIPNKFPMAIGVITSKDSDALQDVISRLKNRFPISNVFIYPTLVQGNEAAQNIITQINNANIDKICDVLMLVRGGGSFEDLMCFNDEDLARSIYKSNIPIVTGIGHQPDITIADYVADISAETPTAAAEKITPDKNDMIKNFIEYELHLKEKTKITFQGFKLKTQTIKSEIENFNPKKLINEMKSNYYNQNKELINELKNVLNNRLNIYNVIDKNLSLFFEFLKNKFQGMQQNQISLKNNLLMQFDSKYNINKNNFHSLKKEILNLSPNKILKKGFAIIRNQNGEIIKKKIDLVDVASFTAEFYDGKVKIDTKK
ncbi:MAG: exodeoxyribonuclease VII large subunit [Gammaproteobacteria bacterium]|nr:exodeoxyribonuclease VII large subunit [Gammaproteobacteria bacterium]